MSSGGDPLSEQINIVEGEVQESNFDSYRVMRMSEAPDIKVSVVSTPGSPIGGIGQVGLRVIVLATASAVPRGVTPTFFWSRKSPWPF